MILANACTSENLGLACTSKILGLAFILGNMGVLAA
jgi:hypothetical protein